MELYKVGLPNDESIIIRDTFVIDKLLPLAIRSFGNNIYTIIFLANQDSTEQSIIIQTPIHADNKADIEFLNNHILNIENITKDRDRLQFYIDSTNDADKAFTCGFDMIEVEKKPFFSSKAAAEIDADHHALLMDLMITRDNFVKINLFFTRLSAHDVSAETVFINHKLHNIKFSTVNHVKLDGSATDFSSRIVCNHYTAGNGPEIYKFNFISMKIPGRKLRIPMSPEVYDKFYSDHFIISDIIYEKHRDCVYLIYEVRSDITDRYKETKALRFDKEFYDKTNLLELDKIYE